MNRSKLEVNSRGAAANDDRVEFDQNNYPLYLPLLSEPKCIKEQNIGEISLRFDKMLWDMYDPYGISTEIDPFLQNIMKKHRQDSPRIPSELKNTLSGKHSGKPRKIRPDVVNLNLFKNFKPAESTAEKTPEDMQVEESNLPEDELEEEEEETVAIEDEDDEHDDENDYNFNHYEEYDEYNQMSEENYEETM